MSNKVASNYLRIFLERHPVRKYKRGEIIVFQGESPANAFVVKSGVIKAYNISTSGDEKPVSFYSQYMPFPSGWIYSKLSNSIYYYEAFTPEVEVYAIDRSEYVDYIKMRPELMYQEFEKLLNDQLGLSIRLNALQHSRASDKLLYTLHYLALSHGERDGNTIKLTLDLTHQDFANLTGLTRETAATELIKLKKLGVITYGKNTPYTVDLNMLMRTLNDQFITDIQLDELNG